MYTKIIAALFLCVFLGACENQTDAPPLEKPAVSTNSGELADTANSDKIVNWLSQRYKKQPPSGGWWVVQKIEANGEDIDVSILTTDEHAGMIMQMPPEAQFKTVSIAACPEAAEEVWQMLDQNHRIMLHVGGSGGVFIDVDCRKWGLE